MSTPMMEQWHSCKKTAKGALLLFRMGDFYEAFYEDASVLAQELELTLTKRQDIPMSGVPWHAAEGYIDRLVSKGYRIAIAEQVEDPKKAKGLVRREIVRFITPGTVVNSALLSEKTHNYIVGVSQVGSFFGLAFCDLTTGEFKVVEVEGERELLNEIYRLHPAECVFSSKFQEKRPEFLQELGGIAISILEEWHFEHKTAYAYLTQHFRVSHLDGFGLKGMVSAINAAGGLLSYIHDELSLPIQHIRSLSPCTMGEALLIDRICQRNLELIDAMQGRDRKNTLLSVIDATLTPMGGRLIREWIRKPLLSVEKITHRQDAIEELYHKPKERSLLRQKFKGVRDLERLIMKISTGYASPRDLAALACSLEPIASIKEIISSLQSALIVSSLAEWSDLTPLAELLKRALAEEPPLRLSDGMIFRDGYDAQLDELREITRDGKTWLSRYQNRVREETGVKTLKVHFNKIFGYYIEVSKGQAQLMPDTFQRRQTLVNSERFISEELKEYEQKVFTAEEKILEIETALFQQLCGEVVKYESAVIAIAQSIALVDVLASLAEVAKREDFHRPVVDESQKLIIKEGRHPIVESVVGKEKFIANDTQLDRSAQLMLITGPNMAGKSTYIRQVALIVILAQMGSFVPAAQAQIGIIDKIFTRIGANDDLARGQSTFMVEMSETANILNNATARSLVILDEIGRGTSTYDGVAIAWSVAEYLLKMGCKTLFATHYWELTALEKNLPGAVNYHASVQENSGQIIFLHKIEKGGTDKSYGIHVARLAGLPLTVLTRAQQILGKLETRKAKEREKQQTPETQLLLF